MKSQTDPDGIPEDYLIMESQGLLPKYLTDEVDVAVCAYALIKNAMNKKIKPEAFVFGDIPI